MRVRVGNEKGGLLCIEQTKVEKEVWCQRRHLSLYVMQQPQDKLPTEGGCHFEIATGSR